jgi:hypothetical protein
LSEITVRTPSKIKKWVLFMKWGRAAEPITPNMPQPTSRKQKLKGGKSMAT